MTSLPGFERLISVLKKYGIGVDPAPPSPRAPRAGELVLGDPFDPQLVELYSRFDGGDFGQLKVIGIDGPWKELVSWNQRMRDGWEDLEPRLLKLFRYAKKWYYEYYFATVPKLADPQSGVQPVVYLDDYDEMPIVPIASSVDRAFDLWARECEFRIQKYGALDARVESEDHFPWGRQEAVAQDRALVRMLEEGRFDELVAPVPSVREWVEEVIAAARAGG